MSQLFIPSTFTYVEGVCAERIKIICFFCGSNPLSRIGNRSDPTRPDPIRPEPARPGPTQLDPRVFENRLTRDNPWKRNHLTKLVDIRLVSK